MGTHVRTFDSGVFLGLAISLSHLFCMAMSDGLSRMSNHSRFRIQLDFAGSTNNFAISVLKLFLTYMYRKNSRFCSCSFKVPLDILFRFYEGKIYGILGQLSIPCIAKFSTY